MGVTIDEITVADPPEAWAAAGFHVGEDGCCRVGGVRLRFVGRDHGKRILGWSLVGVRAGSLDAGAIDGLPTSSVDATDATDAADDGDDAAAAHPNGARHIDHVVVLSPDLDRTVAGFEAIGLSSRGERTTESYGAPMKQVFFRMGGVIIEVVGSPDQAGQGDAGFFGLAITVDDLDATKELLGDHLGDTKDAVQPGRRIATLRHRELGMSVATALMSPEPAPG